MKEKLEQKIKELVPSLMEVSPVIESLENEFDAYGDTTALSKDYLMGRRNAIYYIIGRLDKLPPIHLEHVLQALIIKVEEKSGISPSHVYYELFEKCIRLYDLTKPFTEQSTELYKFLSDILIDE